MLLKKWQVGRAHWITVNKKTLQTQAKKLTVTSVKTKQDIYSGYVCVCYLQSSCVLGAQSKTPLDNPNQSMHNEHLMMG